MDIREKVSNLPTSPGCYLYKNKYGKIIYVGKAKNLRNRVKSYFNGAHSGKTQMLVNDIVDVEFIITSTETESLVLELNLIKEHDPKYNILLTDDKSYPYILLTDEKYPKLIITRNKSLKKSRGKLFGPYPDSGAARDIVELINRNYPLVKCRKIPKEECLYYHIGQCMGPCINDVSTEEYNEHIKEVLKILKGDTSNLMKKLKTEMKEASDILNFERALELKQMQESIEIVTEKQHINVNRMLNIDVINFEADSEKICIQLLYIRNGKIIERVGEIFDVIDDYNEVLLQYILNMYHDKVLPDELVIPKIRDLDLLKNIIPTSIVNYTKGAKANYLKMAHENAKIILEKYYSNEVNEYNKSNYINEELKAIIGKECFRIDMFDISHHAGVDTVGALVVSKDFKFNKNDYRKFKISIEQNDDVASLKEVVYRYYFRVLMENMERPDLIMADGGITQVNAIQEIMDSLNMDITVIGLVKDAHHKTSHVLYQNNLIELESRSDLFKYFTRMQDEVHRFAIGYHHTLASRNIGASKLDEISGVGAKRKALLIKHYKSIENIKSATLASLEEVVPKNIAKIVYEFFNAESKDDK